MLTVRQPWATLIAIGAKQIETRSRKTNYRGLLAIHSSVRISKRDEALITKEPFKTAMMRDARPGGSPWEAQELLPCGVILATCRLVKCLPTEAIRSSLHCTDEWWFGDYSRGRWAWMLSDVRRLVTPIPAKGQLGLWEIDDALLAGARYVEVEA
jgi:hypothetical protein